MPSTTDFPYTARFEAIAKVITPSDEDQNVAKASLSNLRGILPPEINPDENPDMLFIAFDGAVCGLCNRNDDCMSAAGALAVNDTARYKFISTEHNRDQVVGVVLHPAFSRFGSNEPLSMEAAASMKEPFNMSYVGGLWKLVDPMLAKFIAKNGDSQSSDALSMSWEVGFKGYNIGVGSHNLFEARIITQDDPTFEEYAKLLRANGGTGKDPAGNAVYRVITEKSVILGYSVVVRPAGHVKGILPLDKMEADTPATQPVAPASETTVIQSAEVIAIEGEMTKRLAALDEKFAHTIEQLSAQLAEITTQKYQKSFITPPPVSVNDITTAYMKIESLEQLKANWEEIRKSDTSLASVEAFVASIENSADIKQYVAKVQEAENRAEQFKQAQAAAELRAKELEQTMATLQKQLEDIRASAAAAEAQAKFTERMASFDEKFDLDEDDRKLIAEDVRSIETDEAFEAYAKKQDKLLCGKKKGAKKTEKTEKKEEPDMKAAIASVTPDTTQVPAINGVTVPEDNKTLLEQITAAFAKNFVVNGQTAEQIAAAAAKKAEQA